MSTDELLKLSKNDLIKLFWTELEKTNPYIASNGKTYCEVKADDCYIVNMWCRLIPGVERTLNGRVVRICVD